MRMTATDTHRLAFVRKEGDYNVKSRMILPPKVFNLLPKTREEKPKEGEAKPAEPVKLKVKADASKIGLELGETTIISRLIEGPYLDYDRVIPKNHPNLLKVNRDRLSAALRRAAVFANPVAKPVTFELKPDSIRLLAETAELGHAEENLEGTYTGAELKIAFNATFMLEFLNHIEGENVALELGSSNNAGLLHPDVETPDRLYLLMPIRMD
jgi:DNA polymerase-3 subunit beta